MSYHDVITFGLSDEQNQKIADSFPVKGCDVLIADTCTDLIAHQCFAVLVDAIHLTNDDYELLISYLAECAAGLYETVFWIGEPQPPKKLTKVLKYYESFEQFEVNIKYHFLDAQRKCKRSKDFSEKLADSLRILAEIRKKPGIKTRELSEIIGKPTRTVLRYIGAIVATGEWLAYDSAAQGWYLEYGKSILFGDPFRDDPKG